MRTKLITCILFTAVGFLLPMDFARIHADCVVDCQCSTCVDVEPTAGPGYITYEGVIEAICKGGMTYSGVFVGTVCDTSTPYQVKLQQQYHIGCTPICGFQPNSDWRDSNCCGGGPTNDPPIKVNACYGCDPDE